jgi:hypothetical protein
VQDKLFEEFNTLSVIYGKLEDEFLDKIEVRANLLACNFSCIET